MQSEGSAPGPTCAPSPVVLAALIVPLTSSVVSDKITSGRAPCAITKLEYEIAFAATTHTASFAGWSAIQSLELASVL